MKKFTRSLRYNFNTALVTLLGVTIISSTFPSQLASADGSGGSIMIETLGPDGKVIPEGLLRPGMPIKLRVTAYNAAGQLIECLPDYGKNQGVAGEQIHNIDEQGNMEMGSSFGSAEVTATCKDLPGVQGKLFVVNNTLVAPRPSLLNPPPAAKPSGGMSTGAILGLVGGLAVAGAVAAVVIAKSSSSSSTTCNHPDLWCKTSDVCCPNGKAYLCTTPAASKGCYTDNFAANANHCSNIEFCTSDY